MSSTNSLKGQAGKVGMTLEIKRKDTGKVETVKLTGTLGVKENGSNTHSSSTKRGN